MIFHMRRESIRTGYRGRALLILGVLDLVLAVSTALIAVSGPRGGSAGFISRTFPPQLLSAVWLAVALACFVFAFRQHDAFAWMLAIGVKVFWGILTFTGWVTGEIAQGYLSSGIWWAFASLVWLISRWPEPRKSVDPGPETDTE